jgi:hypothetical protein
MSTATKKGYVHARLDELEAAPILAPGATDTGRQRFDVRRRMDITAFGVQAFRARAASTSSTSTTRPPSCPRPARRSSTSS